MKQVLFTALIALLVGIFAVPVALHLLVGSNEGADSAVDPDYAWIDSPAPSLKVAQWIKGGPLDLREGIGKNVYVVEFWATWCPPCQETIPHLTAIQRQFREKNVVVVGISGESAAEVRPFVQRMGANMGYVVALDRNDETYHAYMNPFGIDGIPHAFVIDRRGILVWHGHPLMGLDTVLERYVE